MNKTLKTVLTVLIVAILSLALIGFSIVALIAWVFGGARFTPDAAIEAASLGASERPCIKTDGLYFYYETELGGEWISDIMIARQNGVGMWNPVTAPRDNYPVYVKSTGEWAGMLIFIEKDGVYHNFYIPPVSGYDEETVPDFVKEGYSTVTVNGSELEPFKHSYFTTESEITELTINGVILSIEK